MKISNDTSLPPNNLVALHRPPLARQTRIGDRVDELLSQPNARLAVRELPEQELYFAIRELGLQDALELLRLCSPEQTRALIDIDCWQRDTLDVERLKEWFRVITELGHERLAVVVRSLDHELMVTYLQHLVRVYDVTAEEPPEEPEGHFYATPDRFYVVDVLVPGGDGQAIDRFLELLYMADLDLGRRVVMGAKWDLGAETEETAYRFRSARMADLGYVDYYEALKVYAYLDPRSLRLHENTAPPPPHDAREQATIGLFPPELADLLRGGELALSRGLQLLTPAEQDALVRHILVLMNQAMSADRTDPGDADAAQKTMLRCAYYFSLGVEYASRAMPTDKSDTTQTALSLPSEDERAAIALRTISPSRLFRAGYSLTVQLARLAAMLTDGGLTTLDKQADTASLLDARHGETIRLLLPPTPRPCYSRLLDSSSPGPRPFRRLADIARTAAVLEEVGDLSKFLTLGLGLRPEMLVPTLSGKSPALTSIRLTDILGTLVANLLLRRPTALVPLHRADLPALRQAMLGLTGASLGLTPAARSAILHTLRERVGERSLGAEEAAALWTPAVDRFIANTLDLLGESVASLPADLSPEHADAVPSLPGLVLQ